MVWTGERLILASSSPTRRRLLAEAGLEFIVEPARIDETTLKARFTSDVRSASDCALALADAKARQVAAGHRGGLVIGADQILVCGDTRFDKPASLAEARNQLRALRGRIHQLVTAACVVQDQGCIWQAGTSAKLTMREFSDAFLDTYLASEGTGILGSVGAYRLEGRGIQLFAQVEGDYFAILGLPLLELLSFLRERGALAS
jgi:nucleoside triphosphate pyrophosphatase